MENLMLYLKESYYELMNKVTWPTWAMLQQSAILVLVATVIFSLIIFVMDLVSKQALTLIYNLNA